MQNKPNLQNTQINISLVLTKDYDDEQGLGIIKKQTQSNPIFNPKKIQKKSPAKFFFWRRVNSKVETEVSFATT